MANEHHHDRQKSGLGWLWALLIIIVLVLIGWWLWPQGGLDGAGTDEAAVSDETRDSAATEGEGFPIAEILASPDEWIGRTVEGEVDVGEVPSDRGFWIGKGGERMFAVVIDEPREVPVDIQSGQTLGLRNAIVKDAATDLDEVPGRPLDAKTRGLLEDQSVFLLVDESDIDMP